MRTIRLEILIFFLSLSGRQVLAQPAGIEQLEREMIPIENFESAIGAFHEAFSGVQLAGLGEATHGTGDFFEIKSELIKYLIVNEGFNTIIFEGLFSNSDLINEYVSQGTGNVYKAIIGLGPWCWYTREVLDLIEWLRVYNADKSPEKKVFVYGCDMQNPGPSVEKLATFLGQQNAMTPDIRSKLESVRSLSSRRKLNREQVELFKETICQLNGAFGKLELDKINIDPIIRHNKRILEQWFEKVSTKKKSSDKRDEFMAENIRFILSLNEESKAVVWAHNVHIALNKDSHQQLIPMGYHLKKYFADRYFAVGFGFNSGTFNAVDGEERTIAVGNAEEGSSDREFSKSQYPKFFLNIRDLGASIPLINREVKSRNVGEHYYPKAEYRYHILSESYDGLIFVRNTRAAQLLDFGLIRE